MVDVGNDYKSGDQIITQIFRLQYEKRQQPGGGAAPL